jgi:hypothetical protein
VQLRGDSLRKQTAIKRMAGQPLEGTRVDEISDRIFRISTPVTSIAGGGITYNQYLLVDDEPHTFTPENGACFRRYRRPSPASSRWNACAGFRSRIVTNRNARQDDRSCSDPDVAPDADGAAKLQTGGSPRWVARMVARQDLHPRPDLRTVADGDLHII